MNVRTHYASRKDQPLTAPFPVQDGFFFALRSGDLCSPDDWQRPTHVRRDWLRVPRPFLSGRRGRLGFYVGWKVFGADNEALKRFPSINPDEVHAGSIAMQGCTIRLSRSVE